METKFSSYIQLYAIGKCEIKADILKIKISATTDHSLSETQQRNT